MLLKPEAQEPCSICWNAFSWSKQSPGWAQMHRRRKHSFFILWQGWQAHIAKGRCPERWVRLSQHLCKQPKAAIPKSPSFSCSHNCMGGGQREMSPGIWLQAHSVWCTQSCLLLPHLPTAPWPLRQPLKPLMPCQWHVQPEPWPCCFSVWLVIRVREVTCPAQGHSPLLAGLEPRSSLPLSASLWQNMTLPSVHLYLPSEEHSSKLRLNEEGQ